MDGPSEPTSQTAQDALHSVWKARGQDGADLDAAVPDRPKVCKNMVNVGFDALAPKGGDLRSAWRAALERDGKLRADAVTIRDLVLGDADRR
jgi:hypothetical protein